MEVEVQVQEQQQVVIPEQPMEQEVHQFNESAFIDTSSSEGSVNMIPATQNLVINRIEMQFEVLGKDLISFLDKQFPNYKTCMHNVMVGPLLPKDMVMDRIHKNLTPVLFMQAIPLAVPASSFAWISKLPSFCGKSMVPFDNVEDSVVPESVIGREVVSRRSNIVPLTPRVTRSALRVQVQTLKQDRKKQSRRNSTTTAVTLFTEEVDTSSWTDSSVRRCTRHMAKANGYKFESMPDKGTSRKKPKSSKSEDAEKEEVVPFIPVPTLQHIGRQLEIPEEEITTEKLMAAPVDTKKKKSSNDI
jgi:hypothetical protein